MSNNFPQDKFGKCERCGRKGYYVDSDGDSTAQSGYKLKEYEGQWLCQLCINELDDEKNDEIVRNGIEEEEEFRRSAGVEKT